MTMDRGFDPCPGQTKE